MACFVMLLDGKARATEIRKSQQRRDLVGMLNSHSVVVEFTLPRYADGGHWSLLIDTNRPDRDRALFESKQKYAVTARSLLLFVLELQR